MFKGETKKNLEFLDLLEFLENLDVLETDLPLGNRSTLGIDGIVLHFPASFSLALSAAISRRSEAFSAFNAAISSFCV